MRTEALWRPCRRAHSRPHSHRDILKHKFLSDLPAGTFFTAETGTHRMASAAPGTSVPRSLVLAAPAVCLPSPHLQLQAELQPMALPGREQAQEPCLARTLGLPGRGEVGVS